MAGREHKKRSQKVCLKLNPIQNNLATIVVTAHSFDTPGELPKKEEVAFARRNVYKCTCRSRFRIPVSGLRSIDGAFRERGRKTLLSQLKAISGLEGTNYDYSGVSL